MLSRVAENLYWIARYVERTENLSRLLDDAYHLDLDAGLLGEDTAPRPLAGIAHVLGCPASWVGSSGPRDRLLERFTLEETGLFSIRSMISHARENARATQESLSTDAWSRLNQLYLFLASPRARARLLSTPYRYLQRVTRECLLFTALIDSTMPRTEAYHFLRIGRYLERVDMTSRIVNAYIQADVHGPQPAELLPPGSLAMWVSLLRSCAAYESYLKEYPDRIDPRSVVRYIIFDEEFPRAMRYGVGRCLDSLRTIAHECGDHGMSAERLLGRLDSDLRYADSGDLFAGGVRSFLTEFQIACSRVGREIELAYFLAS